MTNKTQIELNLVSKYLIVINDEIEKLNKAIGNVKESSPEYRNYIDQERMILHEKEEILERQYLLLKRTIIEDKQKKNIEIIDQTIEQYKDLYQQQIDEAQKTHDIK